MHGIAKWLQIYIRMHAISDTKNFTESYLK